MELSAVLLEAWLLYYDVPFLQEKCQEKKYTNSKTRKDLSTQK